MRGVDALLAQLAVFVAVIAVGPAADVQAAQGTWRGTITIDAAGRSTAEYFDATSHVRSVHATLVFAGASGADGAGRSMLTVEQRRVRLADDYRYDVEWRDPWAERNFPPWRQCTSVYGLRSRGPVAGTLPFRLEVGQRDGRLAPLEPYIDRYPGSQIAPFIADPSCPKRVPIGDDVLDGGLGVCRSGNGHVSGASTGVIYAIPGLRRLRRVELRRERGRLVRRVVLQGAVTAPCGYEGVSSAPMAGEITYRFDLVFTPRIPRYEPQAAGGMGLTCGRAAVDWHTVAKRRTPVRKGDHACLFLLGNPVARELLAQAVGSGRTLTAVFGRELATVATGTLAAEATDLAIGVALRQRGWSLLAKHAPHYFRVFRAFAWQVRIGEAVALQAVPLSALFAMTQIRSRGACVQVITAVKRGRLALDWQLVYAPNALKRPRRDHHLTQAHTYRRVVRRFRSDRLERRYSGLRCGRGGVVALDSAAPNAFSRVTALTAG